MVTENRRYRDKLKVVKVIESCNTLDQLQVASKMAREYSVTYNHYSELLDYTHYRRTCQLLEEQANET